MLDRSRKRPANPKQLAKRIVAIVTGKEGDMAFEGKNPAAVALGRLGGLKGGKARAQSLSRKQRADIARRAATARWKNDR
jgi:hypothetical protein